MKREPKHDWGLWTLVLLMGAILALFITPIIRAYDYSVEASRNKAIAQEIVAPKLSIQELEQEVALLKEQSMKLGNEDYPQYFIILNRLRMLDLTARILDRKGTGIEVYQARQLTMTINMAQNDMANNFLPRFHTATNMGDIFNSPEFKRAQATAENADALVKAATPQGEYSFEGVAKVWGYAYLACLPFAFLGVCILMQRIFRATPLEIFFSFFGDYRPWVAGLAGPCFWLVIPVMYMHREKLIVNMRFAVHALCGLLSCFIGGVGVAKAQKPDASGGKKKSNWSYAIIERPEVDSGGLTNTLIVDAEHKPTGTTLEGIVVKGGGGFMRTYGLVVQKWKAKQTGTMKASLAGVFGIETFKTGGVATTVYAVVGARVGLQWGKYFSWNTPHLAFEQPLNGNTSKYMGAVITRPAINVTPRIKIVNEWFGRFTNGGKPKVTTGIFGSVTINKRASVEFGPFRNNAGITGFRAQLAYSF